MLTEKDYCDYETRAELIKLGYPAHIYDNTEVDKILGAILLYEAQKWLREEKKMSINITNVTDGTFVYSILRYSNGHWQQKYMSFFHDGKIDERGKYLYYEEALLGGIKEIVKILEEK